MNPSLSVSIAMATYNGERFLRDQLDSLAQQTLLPDELVICDDHSTRFTARIARQFSDEAPFQVRLVVNPVNIGFIRNFEKAVSLCRSDLIFLCDQDDYWSADKIEATHAASSGTPTHLSCGPMHGFATPCSTLSATRRSRTIAVWESMTAFMYMDAHRRTDANGAA